ncbi:alpha/beta hydrolase [Holophaga foetida]|uniref:alpha/beta hydrolase n=1 Tax=Holophaga foetida TaxID=35839 RepID=UPI0002471C7F|nr:alpha/beta hydrolase [Holophaga foetida]
MLVLLLSAALLLALAAAIAFGGPGQHPPERRVYDPFPRLDVSTLPPLQHFRARDGRDLAYRTYRPAKPNGRSVVIVHGSANRSENVHPLAQALAGAGFQVHALDIRGHGHSGPAGQADYVGQPEDDLEDFLEAEKPQGQRILIGFSAGGGFALRFASGGRQRLFDRYLLLAPLLGERTPASHTDTGDWVSAGSWRIAGLNLLNALGIGRFNHLPVLIFAVSDRAKVHLTHTYTYNLAISLRPPRNYRGAIRAARQPMQVLVGAADKVFRPEGFAEIFRQVGSPTPVTLIPGVGHSDMTTKAIAIEAVVGAALEEPDHRQSGA